MYVYLAGTAFDDYVTVLTDGTGLLRVGFGGSGVGLGLEVVLFVRHGSLSRSRRKVYRQQRKEADRKERMNRVTTTMIYINRARN